MNLAINHLRLASSKFKFPYKADKKVFKKNKKYKIDNKMKRNHWRNHRSRKEVKSKIKIRNKIIREIKLSSITLTVILCLKTTNKYLNLILMDRSHNTISQCHTMICTIPNTIINFMLSIISCKCKLWLNKWLLIKWVDQWHLCSIICLIIIAH